jgi:endoglycosylceramidase
LHLGEHLLTRLVAGAALVAALALAGPAHATLPPLHAERGADPAIVTADGRQVLLRGVNVNQLGDYYQQRADLPPTIPLREQDFARIGALGMNVVRLLVHWSALEPRRGAFDAGYLERIREAVGWARAHNVYVVLDMHQDAWGKFIASPPGETCAPGFTHQQGWDGAPEWATLTDGAPTCRLGVREVAPAVGQAWTSFYGDRDGIESELVATWARLARAFAADPTVAGYDLINEPNPGYAPGAADATLLGDYYRRAIAAIRDAERGARGGFSHIAFFEPGVLWSALATDATPPPALVDDPNAVFAPHLYGGSIALAPVSVTQGFDLAAASASSYQSTVWSGEWGWFGDPAADEPQIREYARNEDAHRWGGAWWDWKQACGDPHQFADGDATQPAAVSPSLNRFACPAQAPLGIPASTRRILARPYARFAPGRLASLASDPDTAGVTVTGSDPDPSGSCRLEVWVPEDAGRAPAYTASHVSGVALTKVDGGWRLTGCARREYALTVR